MRFLQVLGTLKKNLRRQLRTLTPTCHQFWAASSAGRAVLRRVLLFFFLVMKKLCFESPKFGEVGLFWSLRIGLIVEFRIKMVGSYLVPFFYNLGMGILRMMPPPFLPLFRRAHESGVIFMAFMWL